jgi:hypothetical protein
LAVGSEVVLAAYPHVIDPSGMRYKWVKTGIRGGVLEMDGIHVPER